MARELKVEIIGDANSLRKAVADSDKHSSKLGSTFAKLGKAGVLAGGAAGVGALAVGLKIGIGEYMQAQKVAAQTNAVIKSTGGVANVTADHVGNLAGKLMKKSGVDDEAIASGENLLLTFTGIRNEVGKGNDIFDQATKAALDMSVAMGTDMSSASMTLGKALNDPLKGMSKLQRQGVTFTDAQKATVEALMKTGQTAKAQSVILGELQKEFGGSAEAAGKTLPGQINILKESFSNFAGEVVAKVIPVLQQFVAWFRENWPTIREVILRAWADIEPVIVALGELVKEVVQIIVDHWDTIGPIVEKVAGIIETQVKIIVGVLRLITSLLRGDWSAAWEALKGIVGNALNLVKGVVDLYKTIIVGAASALGEAIKAAVVAGLTGIGNAAWDVINNIGQRIADFPGTIKGWGADVGNAVKNAAINALSNLGNLAWNEINDIGSAIVRNAKAIIGWGAELGNAIKNAAVSALSGLGQAIANMVRAAVNAVINKLNRILEFSIDLPNRIPGLPNEIEINPPDIPTLALGGNLLAGQSAIVGEAGAELITARRASTVIPNRALGAAQQVIHNVLMLDGKVLYESWEEQRASDLRRNGQTVIG